MTRAVVLVSAIVTLLLMSSCARFTYRIPSRAHTEDRTVLAGATLACAGESARVAIILSLVSAGVAGLSPAAGTAAVFSDDPGVVTFLSVASVGLGVASLAAGVGSLVAWINFSTYTEQAGHVLAGYENVGGCESQPLPTERRSHPFRGRR